MRNYMILTNKKALFVLGSFFLLVLAIMILPYIIGVQKTDTQDVSLTDFKGELVFWNIFDEEDLYTGLIQEYQSKHPGVRIAYKKYMSLGEYERDFVNELAEGKGPDIVAIHPSWVQKHTGKLIPMPETFPYAHAEKFKDTFLGPAYTDLIKTYTDEKGMQLQRVFALPIAMDSLGIIYNRKIFTEEVGKNMPGATWGEFQNDVKAATKIASGGKKILRSGVAMGDIQSISRGFEVIFTLWLQNGVRMYDTNMQDVTITEALYTSGKSFFPAEDALRFFKAFTDNKSVNFSWDETLSVIGERELGAFAQGKVAAIFGYSYYIKEVERIINQYKTIPSGAFIALDEVRSSAFPQLEIDAAQNIPKVTLANYFPLSVAKNTKNVQVSWDFINFLAQQDQQRFFFRKNKKLTSRYDLVDEQLKDPLYGPFVRQNMYAVSMFLPEQEVLYTELVKQFDELKKQLKDEKELLSSFQSVWQCEMDKFLDKKNTPACKNLSTFQLQR